MMTIPTTECGFQTTSWTLIAQARDGEGLAELLERYWSPIFAYLRRAGKPEADALDLTQGFLTSRLIEKNALLDRVDREKGKFRSYLLTSLQNYVRDQHRRMNPKSVPQFVPKDAAVIAATEPAAYDDPTDAFNRQWATATFDGALRQVEEECKAMDMERQWRAFEKRVLLPKTRGVTPPAIEIMIEELGVRNRQQVYDMIETIKRKVQRAVRDMINETVDDPAEVEAEIGTLRAFLAKT